MRKERDQFKNEVNELKKKHEPELPQASSLALEGGAVLETESKEMADLRIELEAQRKENNTLMKQFQAASETIRVLNDANKHH
jgi:hypothetical protein